MSFHYICYNKFYYGNLCHVCKEPSENLKKCSSCKSIGYCSREHQKVDWKHHKHICKVIVKTDEDLKAMSVHNFTDFKNYNTSRSLLWQKELSRSLFTFECHMWMFPRVCAVCFSKNVAIDCARCLNVSYCSTVHENLHEKLHSKFCAALKLCMDFDVYDFQKKFRPTDIDVFEFKQDLKTLPNNLKDLFVLYENCEAPTENNSDGMIQFIIKSNYVAPAATILYGMEKSGLLKDRFLGKSNLTVHIVGAEGTAEMTWLWKLITELPFHWIKDLERLHFCVVGPDLCHNGDTVKFAGQLCDSCKARNPGTKISFRWNLYHNVVQTLDKPDIVVALNSGLHEIGDTWWMESIDFLTMYSGVPLLLTAYTMNEIVQDVDVVRSRSSHNVSVVLQPQRNPFSNMKPARDWETENSPIFYVNGYLAILKADK